MRIRGGAYVLAVVVLAGCSFLDPSEPIDYARPASTACVLEHASVAWGTVAREDVITGAMRFDITRSGERSANSVHPDEPMDTWVEGLPAGDERAAWLMERAGVVVGKIEGPTRSPALGHDFPASLKKPGRYIGFVGVTRVTLPYSFICGPQVDGALHLWEKPTSSVFQCGTTPVPGSFSEQAKQYCQV